MRQWRTVKMQKIIKCVYDKNGSTVSSPLKTNFSNIILSHLVLNISWYLV